MTIPNHITLDDLRNMQIGEIVALSAEQLALLQDAANEVLRSAKTTSDWLEGAIALKYTDRAVMARMEASKDTGTVRFDDGTVTVIADLPKRVDWDQAQLAGLVERISAAGDDPTEYVDVSFKVPERKYAAWPESIRQNFEPARTVRTGALKVSLRAPHKPPAPPRRGAGMTTWNTSANTFRAPPEANAGHGKAYGGGR